MRAKLQRLRAEVGSDRAAVDLQISTLEKLALDEPDGGDLAQAAVALHHAYGAVEGALARVARTLGEGLPEGGDWHQALLHVMALEVEGVRPAVLSPESAALLRRLLAFRHFFRHAYAVALDAARLAALRTDALKLRPILMADFERLDLFLKQVAEASQG